MTTTAVDQFATLARFVALKLEHEALTDEQVRVMWNQLPQALQDSLKKVAKQEANAQQRRAFEAFAREHKPQAEHVPDKKELNRKAREEWKSLPPEQKNTYAQKAAPKSKKRKQSAAPVAEEGGDHDQKSAPLPWTTKAAEEPFSFGH